LEKGEGFKGGNRGKSGDVKVGEKGKRLRVGKGGRVKGVKRGKAYMWEKWKG
jgi:hypothetical protein